jgi:hypothetical protein
MQHSYNQGPFIKKKTKKLGHPKLYDFTVGFLFLLIKKYNKMEKESSCHKTAFFKIIFLQ